MSFETPVSRKTKQSFKSISFSILTDKTQLYDWLKADGCPLKAINKLKQHASMFNTSRLKVALPALPMALFILALLKFAWKAQKPLILYSGCVLLCCFVLFYTMNRVPKRGALTQAILLVLLWIVTTSSSLGILYLWDRAGWVWFKATGHDIVIEENLSHLISLPISQFAEQNPIFFHSQNGSTHLVLHKGEYEIAKTCIVPKGAVLVIEPGTVLRFRAGCSLISYSPIVARGTQDEPIKFLAKDKWRKWGSVGVVSKERSIFEYTVFENGRRAHVNGVDFWGALSLIESEVEIANSEFRNLYGKDGVNVVNGKVLIRKNVFLNCSKDGLDLDAGSGEISDNEFIDCDDEGIDLSANLDIRVFNNTILDTRGGRLGAEQKYEEIVAANTFGFSKKN